MKNTLKILLAVVALSALAAVRPPKPNDKDFIALNWDYTQGTTAAEKFRVYHGRTPGTWDGFVDTAGLEQKADIEVTSPGDWYFTATALSADGLESLPSNTLRVVIAERPQSPGNLTGRRITVFVD